MDYFTSDLHLSHIMSLKHRPRFTSVEEMDNTILKAFKIVKRGDRLFILGDLGWDDNKIINLLTHLTQKIKIDVFWIQGNHDKHLFDVLTLKRLHKCQSMTVKSIKDTNGNIIYNSIFLSHYPQLIYNKSHYNCFQLHGHGHIDTIDKDILDNIIFGKRLNVNIELHDFKLWNRDEVEEYMKTMPDNLDYLLLEGNDATKKIVVDTLKNIHNITNNMYNRIKGENK